MAKTGNIKGLAVIGSNSKPVKANTSEGVARRTGISKSKLPKLSFKGSLAFAASKVPGGKKVFMEYVKMGIGSDERIKELIERWKGMSKSDQRRTNLDDLCEEVGISPGEVMGIAARCAFDYNSDVSNMIAAVMQPQILEATIENALRPEGFQDRKLLHQHAEFLPAPHGQVVNVNARAIAVAESDERGLPSFESTVDESYLTLDEYFDAEIREEKERWKGFNLESVEGHRIFENEDESMAEQSEESGEPEY